MTPSLRTVLLEAQYALDHVVWSYRSELDRAPSQHLTADDILLSDFAFRTGALVRSVLDEDNRRRGPQLAFRPPSNDPDRQLAQAIQARRRARATEANAVSGTPPVAPTERADATPPPGVDDDTVLTPDAVSPSRMPLRRRL